MIILSNPPFSDVSWIEKISMRHKKRTEELKLLLRQFCCRVPTLLNTPWCDASCSDRCHRLNRGNTPTIPTVRKRMPRQIQTFRPSRNVEATARPRSACTLPEGLARARADRTVSKRALFGRLPVEPISVRPAHRPQLHLNILSRTMGIFSCDVRSRHINSPSSATRRIHPP